MDGETQFVPISGSHNLRDLGGYPTSDGKRVKRGLLFRSGVMTGLSEDDRADFRRLGIVSIFDLRDNEERSRRPTDWHIGEEIEYHQRDYEMSLGGFDTMMRSGNLDPESAQEFIREAYRKFPFEQADSYRSLFGLLVRERLPLLFNCTAGKDRTGVAAALILFALGVPQDLIEHDYSLTEHATEKLVAMMLGDPRYAQFAKLPRDTYLPMLRADPSYLAIAFGEIEARCGSIKSYLDEVLGVGSAQIAVLRKTLLDH